MKKVLVFIVLAFGVMSCSDRQTNKELTVEGLKTDIQQIDDSLKMLYDKARETENFNIAHEVYFEAIARNKSFYEHFPNDEFAETALNKIAAMYFQLNMEGEASKWRDTLLNKFPTTKNKATLMELQMSYYGNDESFSQEMIEYYGNELLKLDGLSEEKKEEIKFRIAHSDKTFMQLIEYQIMNEEGGTDENSADFSL